MSDLEEDIQENVQESLHRLMDFWEIYPNDQFTIYRLFYNLIHNGANPWEEREEDWGNPYGSSYDERSPFSRFLEIFLKLDVILEAHRYFYLSDKLEEIVKFFPRYNKKLPLPLEKIVQEVLYTFPVEEIYNAINALKSICMIEYVAATEILCEGYSCVPKQKGIPAFRIPTYEIYLLNKKKEEEEEWAERIRETKERSENNGHLLRCSVFKEENKIEEESPEDIYVPSEYSLCFSTESLKCDCGKHATTGSYNMCIGEQSTYHETNKKEKAREKGVEEWE